MKNAVILLLLLLLPNLSNADDYKLNPNIDIQNYVFKLTLNDASNNITGETTIKVLFKTDGTKKLAFDLLGLGMGQKTKDGKEAGMSVISVNFNGAKAAFSHTENMINIDLTNSPKAGTVGTVTITYSGIPADGLIIGKNLHGDRVFFGDNWPDRARHWLPSMDHLSDKATNEFIVTAPSHYKVIANGLLREETHIDDNTTITHWVNSVPIPTYLMVIGVARFAVETNAYFKNIPIQTWVYYQDRDKGFYDFDHSLRIMEFFDQRIGDYPYEKLANVQSKTRYGGMENASAIFYNERAVKGTKSNAGTVVHEIAHQWFGDGVTEKDWHHAWLSEGFATYFTTVYYEFTEGRDNMNERLRSSRDRIVQYYQRNPAPIVDQTVKDLNALLNTNSYQKGGFVLHMLRRKIGEDAFWKGIRQYYSDYMNSVAMTEDLQRVMEEKSGMDLNTFFKQWIYTAGQPEFKGNWTYNKKAKTLTIKLEQTQMSNFIFETVVEFGIYFGDDEKVEFKNFTVDKASNTFTVELENNPTNVKIDPNVWLLHTAEFVKK